MTSDIDSEMNVSSLIWLFRRLSDLVTPLMARKWRISKKSGNVKALSLQVSWCPGFFTVDPYIGCIRTRHNLVVILHPKQRTGSYATCV